MKLARIKTYTSFISIYLIITFALIVLNMVSFSTTYAYTMDHGELPFMEELEQDNSINFDKSEELKNTLMLSGGGGRSGNIGIISGATTLTLSYDDLTNVKYIPNSNYFLINPQHAVNDGTDNAGGTCTTVAVQMLLGYHNYYSDRRIIPEVAVNGMRFLDPNYGDSALHPEFQRAHVNDTWSGGEIIKRGCEYLGTQNGVYQDIFDRTWISDWYGIGQAVGLVKDGAIRFLNAHTPTDVRNNISITSGFFSKSSAQADIDAGRPIVLGMQSIFSGASSFHVVPAYGYAKLDGVDGFLVHYGWGASRTQVWVPASWFGFQIRMNVNHTHVFTDTGVNKRNTHRELMCSTCGATTVDTMYDHLENDIIGTKYSLLDTITIPNSISNYSIHTASFTSQSITAINSSALANQTQLSQVIIPSSITHIGSNAFQNTNNASIYLEGRTSAPITFDINWNASSNPVYLNDNLCTHHTTTLMSINYTQHGHLCNTCRTFVSKSNHNHNVEHIPLGTAPSGIAVHASYCRCGHSVTVPCVSRFPHLPGDTVICMYCGQAFSNPLFMMTLPNGESFVSNAPFTYHMFEQLVEHLDITYSYTDFVASTRSSTIDYEYDISLVSILPSRKETLYECC